MGPSVTPYLEHEPAGMEEAGGDGQSLDFSLAEAHVVEEALGPVSEELNRLQATTPDSLPPHDPEMGMQMHAQVLRERLLPIGRHIVAVLAEENESDRGEMERLLCRFIASRFWPAEGTYLDIMRIYRNALFRETPHSELREQHAQQLLWQEEVDARQTARGSFGDAARRYAASVGLSTDNDFKDNTSDVSSATRERRRLIAEDEAYARKLQEEEDGFAMPEDFDPDLDQRHLPNWQEENRVFVWDPVGQEMLIDFPCESPVPSFDDGLFDDVDMDEEDMAPTRYMSTGYGDDLDDILAEADQELSPRGGPSGGGVTSRLDPEIAFDSFDDEDMDDVDDDA